MNKSTPCKLIQDILPLYIDSLVSEESELLVKEHLENCDCCRKKYETLSTEIKEKNSEIISNGEIAFDYLKKINTYQKKTFSLGCIISFLLGFLLPLAIFATKVIFLWNGNIPDYYLARLQIAWHILALRMIFFGMITCAVYVIINTVLKKKKSQR